MKKGFVSLLRWLAFLFVSIFILTFLFHWRLAGKLTQLSNIDAWAVSLDISIAHMVITFPIILASIIFLMFTFKLVPKIVDWLTDPIADKLIENKRENQTLPSALIVLYLLIVLTMWILVTYGVFRLDKLLILDTIDLQKFVFGKYDSFLGFSYPTSYRFTYIIDNFEILRQGIVANSTFAKIFSGIGAVAVLVGGLVSISKILDYLSEKFK